MELTSCVAEKVYQNFWAFYQQSYLSGELSPWAGEEVSREVREVLETPYHPGTSRFTHLDFYRIARDFVKGVDPRPGENPFRALGKAFEVLELIAVNLFLCPWRKEIRSLKTFTGTFVYFLQPAFPADGMQGMLEKLGYSRRDSQEYVMRQPPDVDDLGHLAFEFLLARSECEVLWEILERVGGSSCLSVIQTRSQLPLSWGEGRGPPQGGGSDNDQPPLDSDAPLPLTDPPASQPDSHPELPASLSDSIDLYTEYPDIHIAAEARPKHTVPVTPEPRLPEGPRSLSSFPDSPDPTVTVPELHLGSRERESMEAWHSSARRYPNEVWLGGGERLPYPIAETLGPEPAHPHHAGTGPEDSVCPIAEHGVWPITELSVCPITVALLADACDLPGSSAQAGTGQEVREPPQSYYIPPLSLQADCSSVPPGGGDIAANMCRALHENNWLRTEVMVTDSEDPFVLISKATETPHCAQLSPDPRH
uniref:Spermatogenesis-associated protein 2 PUB-like domain-containing protein n=1 Tax=Callorhinchus milii TaxID=7868 RepID=A0A4W3JUY3_CALMI